MGMRRGLQAHFESSCQKIDNLETNVVSGSLVSRPWIAETQLAYAALLLERGGSEDRQHAEALLDQACATADELGMAAVTRHAEALRG